MGSFQEIENEIRSRFYRWALRDAEREVRAGYPLLQRIQSRTTKKFLNYMSGLTEDEQLELALALARRAHEFSVRQNDDALTAREKQLAAGYIRFQREYSDLDTEEGFIRSWVPRRATGLPPRAKLKRKAFLNKVKTALTPVLSGFNERHWEEALWFEGKYNRWALKTAVNVGRPPHYFHYISADWRTVLTTTITSWLGVGDGVWDVLYEDQSDAAAETLALLCGHFMTAVPELLGRPGL